MFSRSGWLIFKDINLKTELYTNCLSVPKYTHNNDELESVGDSGAGVVRVRVGVRVRVRVRKVVFVIC